MTEFYCDICPHSCNALRDEKNGFGICKAPALPVISRYAPHFFEEPCISGKRGSGTVFFSGCNLQCEYCQNKEISAEIHGKKISIDDLRKIYFELINMGVHNINLVTPTHYVHAIAKSLSEKLPVPVVYNTSGYDKISSLMSLDGKIDIYLADLKYGIQAVANKYSLCKNYVSVAKAALDEMYRQCKDFVIDENGIMQKGLIIRHLVLPNEIENTFEVIDYISDNFKNKRIIFSLMSQYTPISHSERNPNLNRKITSEEYKRITDYLEFCNIEYVYLQELDSASDSYIPDFDLK